MRADTTFRKADMRGRQADTPVKDPQLVIFNRSLADELGLKPGVEREAATFLIRVCVRWPVASGFGITQWKRIFKVIPRYVAG
jgi:hypothetical protein